MKLFRVLSPIILTATILFSLCCALRADDTAAPMCLEELIGQLRLNNPQIKQAKQNYIADKAAVPQATVLNNPQVGFVETPIPESPLNLYKSEGLYYTLTQSFSFPGKKHLAGGIAEAQADIAQTQVDILALQLTAQLKNDFYQLLVLQKQFGINQENIQRLEQIKQIAKVKYANNAAAYVDYLNAQVTESSAENDQFALQKQIDTMRKDNKHAYRTRSLNPAYSKR